MFNPKEFKEPPIPDNINLMQLNAEFDWRIECLFNEYHKICWEDGDSMTPEQMQMDMIEMMHDDWEDGDLAAEEFCHLTAHVLSW